ncbi:MAG: TVP38/TMEM64 family protein [Nitrospirae bacterium]|nr:TVP38/TMEM64 family protein [Candidatus Troglogloeales bacterium]
MLFIGIAAALILSLFVFDRQAVIEALFYQVEEMGPWVFIVFYTFATLLFVPVVLLAMGAGLLFGVPWGIVYGLTGALTSAATSFLIGRSFARDWVAQKIHQSSRFEAATASVARDGWKIVLLIRLSTIFPCALMNYAFGMTPIPLKEYILASFFGMLPIMSIYVYIGSIVGDIAKIGSVRISKTPMEWAFYALLLLSTIAITIYATRIARTTFAKTTVKKGAGE